MIQDLPQYLILDHDEDEDVSVLTFSGDHTRNGASDSSERSGPQPEANDLLDNGSVESSLTNGSNCGATFLGGAEAREHLEANIEKFVVDGGVDELTNEDGSLEENPILSTNAGRVFFMCHPKING